MKKLTVLLVVLALALVAVPAFALNNIVVNGDFQTGNFTGWTQASGHTYFVTGDSYYASSRSTTSESGMYQVINANTSTGWVEGGTAETISFSFDYRRPDTAIAEYGLFVNYSTSATAPAFGGNDAPGAGWVALSINNTEPGLAQTTGSNWATITYSHTFDDSQPMWFAVALEAQSHYVGYPSFTTYTGNFDNVSLTTECTPAVPVPPSVLLLGSGLLGLGVMRFRKA